MDRPTDTPEPLAGILLRDGDPDLADQLARDLGAPRLERPPARGLVLAVDAAGLGLLDADQRRARPLRVDLVGGDLGARLRRRPTRSEPLARAVGARPGRPLPRILDATAGLLRDAAVLASLGCPIVACERQPVVAALAVDGLRRAAVEPRLAPLVERIELLAGDTLARLTDLDADVALVDTMFPSRSKAALVKQPMRWLRRLTGPDADAPNLLQQCRERFPRVVFKRPADAALADGPDLQVPAGQVRFDVWLG